MKNNELLVQIRIAYLIKWCFILLLVVAVFCLFWVVLSPYFVYFDIPKGVAAVVVACCIAIPWSWRSAVSHRKIKLLEKNNAFKQRNPNTEVINEIIKSQPKSKYEVLFWCAGAAIGLYVLIHGADQLDQINQINHAQQRVTDAMALNCVETCALYGIAQSDLIGPKIVHAYTFEPHSGKQDYLFSWSSEKSAVQVTGRFYNFDGQRWVQPQAIDLKWNGKLIPAVVTAENSINLHDFEPHYTTVRDDFKSVFDDAQPEINNAFMRAKLSAPKLQGNVTVHVIINTYGQVTAANIDSSELESPEFENNLIYIIKGLDFKSGEFATMEKNYTFDFQ